ncbi:MAG: tRNA guanosine(15) transglycosylase TgtA [archaeon GB-1867-005]|nr:tRNA guanosine(15) transglycosylase TgtA [Candidatus Culexmicrobium cathedralense]
MIFEILDRDLAGRIGRLRTKSGTIETPAFFPVISPHKNVIPVEVIKEKYGLRTIITNAYLVKKFLNESSSPIRDIHEMFNFPYTIMTDSGAYQILVYGAVSIGPDEVIRVQEALNSDIAVILDIPTPRAAAYNEALKRVKETLKNAEISLKAATREDIIWVGPVQGGKFLDLVEYCAKKIGEMNFQMHGIGGPTQFMEKYKFDELVDLVVTAKKALPLERPIHLFGAGHPITLPLLVALGCDTFDSAAYAIYARDERYMTSRGTIKLSRLHSLPCSCDVCRKMDVEDLKEMSREMRIRYLAEHNLAVVLQEMNNIRQAIHEGTLWELIEMRAKAHPQLYQAVLRLKKYKHYLEKFDPVVKSKVRGIFYTTSEGLIRPEVTRHVKRLSENVRFPGKRVLLLLPDPHERPFHESNYVVKVLRIIEEIAKEKSGEVHECIYCLPFGIVPLELDEVYPLSQYEKSIFKDLNAESIVLEALNELIKNNDYKTVIFFEKSDDWSNQLKMEIMRECKKLNREIKVIWHNDWKRIREVLSETLRAD